MAKNTPVVTPFAASPFSVGSNSDEGFSGGADIGDYKHNARSIIGNGWVLCAGQLISTLTATQQAAAILCGFNTNLPDGKNRGLVGASVTKSLGSIGGLAEAIIDQANLPNISLTSNTTGSHTHTRRGYYGAAGGGNDCRSRSTLPADPLETVTDPAGNHSHTIPLGGSGVPIATEDPWLAANLFIYLGV